jgi:peptide/nickel transport system permease protein
MRSLRFFFSRWQNLLGVAIILTFTFVALGAPLISPPNKTTQGAFKKVGHAGDLVPHPPTEEAILGTLPGQLDVFHAIVWGSREALQFGLLVALGAFIFGVLFGAVSGYAGGTVNGMMMRIADAFLTFPVLAGVVFLQQMVAMTVESMGGTYWFNNDYYGRVVDFQFTPPPFAVFLMKVDPILICLIIFSWMPIARIVNTMVITLKNTDFIQATRALGGGPFWIIRRHLIPNSVGPAIVLAARDVGNSVILQATITFVGLGGQSAWGMLLSRGRNWVIGPGGDLLDTWWVFLPATLAIVLFGVGWNLIGDGLTEVLDLSVVAYAGNVIVNQKQKKIEIGVPEPVHLLPEAEESSLPSSAATVSSSRIPAGGPPELDPLLVTARDALSLQDFERAVYAYSHLSEHGRHLQEIIQDLAQAVRQYPQCASMWKALGDALTQAGNHEYAAKAYEQFRHLTR